MAQEDLVFVLEPGQSGEIPSGHVKATASNQTDKEGSLFFKINPPVQTEGTLSVPPHETVPLGFGDSGASIKNVGPVPLTIVYNLGG